MHACTRYTRDTTANRMTANVMGFQAKVCWNQGAQHLHHERVPWCIISFQEMMRMLTRVSMPASMHAPHVRPRVDPVGRISRSPSKSKQLVCLVHLVEMKIQHDLFSDESLHV